MRQPSGRAHEVEIEHVAVETRAGELQLGVQELILRIHVAAHALGR